MAAVGGSSSIKVVEKETKDTKTQTQKYVAVWTPPCNKYQTIILGEYASRDAAFEYLGTMMKTHISSLGSDFKLSARLIGLCPGHKDEEEEKEEDEEEANDHVCCRLGDCKNACSECDSSVLSGESDILSTEPEMYWIPEVTESVAKQMGLISHEECYDCVRRPLFWIITVPFATMRKRIQRIFHVM